MWSLSEQVILPFLALQNSILPSESLHLVLPYLSTLHVALNPSLSVHTWNPLASVLHLTLLESPHHPVVSAAGAAVSLSLLHQLGWSLSEQVILPFLSLQYSSTPSEKSLHLVLP